MVAQNFKEVDNESDVGEGRKWGGLDKPALREGQGGGRSWVRGVGSHEAGACLPQPGRGCSQPPCPQHLLPRWGDQTARGAAVSLAVGTDVNSTSILSLSAPWTSLWWQCKPTFDNPNIGNSHFEHFQEKLGEKVVPELGLQERVCWGPNVYSLSGPPTPWYQKNAALFLNFTFHLTNARGCGFAFWSYTDNWGCQCGISLTPNPPSPSPSLSRTASLLYLCPHRTSRKVAHLFWSPLLASVSVEPSSR